ncbi:NUDIX domain-containing protein [Pelagibacterium lacus]|nr:NUDIX domain-containing protein [Pelagibacterium lacus]
MTDWFDRLKFSLMLRAVGLYKHMTLGARVAVVMEGKVLMVRHTYSPGWQLPGGGVDPGETLEQAGRREVLEETGYAVAGPMRLFAMYHSVLYTDRDHVALFVVEGAEMARAFAPGREIAEIGWLALDALPDDLSPSARRRLAEIAGEAPIHPNW